MSKGKKKQRGGHHVKYDVAEQKRNFFRKIEFICSAVAGPGIYDMIPPEGRDLLYRMRGLPPKVVAAPNEQIPDETLKQMRRLFMEFVRQENVSLFKDGPEISLADYYSAGEELQHYLSHLQDNKFPRAPELKEAMLPFTEIIDKGLEPYEEISRIINAVEITCSDLSSKLFWLEIKSRLRSYEPMGMENLILVHVHTPERIHVTFDGVSRTAIKATWAANVFDGIKNFNVKPDALGIPNDGRNTTIDVYVQTHALQRLAERLDCISAGARSLYLCLSLAEPCVQHEKDGVFLIEYRLRGRKVGYLVTEINDGALVVRTFLFMTNDGTPEGRRLREICGLGRLDREFLSIDKLSTFIATDMKCDKELEELFLEAGCGSLLELREDVEGINTKEGMASSLPMLRKYLGLDSKGDFLTPDPLEKFRRKFEMEE